MSDYTILVNSTDSFEDCWYPFFKLLSIYWPDCKLPIILNTETKDFSFSGLSIRSSKTGAQYVGNRSAWGECMIKCLADIDTDIILYLQDDYFLNAPVDSCTINEFANYMHKRNAACIGLTHFSGSGPFNLSENPLLWEVDRRSKYRLSLQAGLWRKNDFLNHVRRKQTPWQFEIDGSIRARHIDDTILTLNRHLFNPSGRMVFPYIGTGIVKGKWNADAVLKLFGEHNIEVDFTKRVFYNPPKPGQTTRRPRNFVRPWLKKMVYRCDELFDRLREL